MSDDEFPTPAGLAKAIAGEDQDLAYIQALMPVIGDFVRLAQLATNGNIEEVPRLVESPRDFYQNLIVENRSALVGYLMVRSLHESMSRPSKKDPLEHAKFVLELVKYEDTMSKIGGGGGPATTPVETTSATDELLSRVDGDSEAVEDGQAAGGGETGSGEGVHDE